jgi:hypothetical protein
MCRPGKTKEKASQYVTSFTYNMLSLNSEAFERYQVLMHGMALEVLKNSFMNINSIQRIGR